MPLFWGQNPLKVPLLCGFKRLSAFPLMSLEAQDHERAEPAILDDEEDFYNWDVIYKAPCGQSLRNHDDVMHFLLATESYDVLQVSWFLLMLSGTSEMCLFCPPPFLRRHQLAPVVMTQVKQLALESAVITFYFLQVDFFTFNSAVLADPLAVAGPRRPELDLSRGSEPTPVELCAGPGVALPVDFRYRKERWPHGCFLSRSGTLFNACCDCTDGCTDAQSCACIVMNKGGRHYTHQRLTEPVPSG